MLMTALQGYLMHLEGALGSFLTRALRFRPNPLAAVLES